MANPHNSGWIKMYRSLQEKAYYKRDSEKVHLWIHLLIKASFSKNKEVLLGGKPYLCRPGEFTTGRRQLYQETGISESKIERILTYFEKIEHQIEQQKTNKNRLITILNWGMYQQNEQHIEQQVNNNRTTSEQQVNTSLECIKNERKRECKEGIIKNILSGKNDGIPYEKIIDHLNLVLGGGKFQADTPKTQSLIRSLWKRKYRLNDFTYVIDIKAQEWLKDPKRKQYLRPKTLFKLENFESYINQRPAHRHQGIIDWLNKKGALDEE